MSIQTGVLVTGGNGFLGMELTKQLCDKEGFRATAVLRKSSVNFTLPNVAVGEIHEGTNWLTALSDQYAVIHTAARVHIMKDSVSDPLTEYRKVNVDGTLNLARQSAAAGVKRFVFISSIKVNGEQTAPGQPFQPADEAKPQDFYGISKWEAEQGLQKIAKKTGMEVVIIRPPLVYGPGVKGNFANLIKLLDKGVPLPLGAIHNRRSMIALGNLVDLIITCIDHPNARNQIFLASDGVDLSTSELLRRLAQAMGRNSRLLPIPSKFLTFAASVMGKKPLADRLLGSLQVDILKTRELLNWSPPFTVDDSLRMCFESKEVRP